jgi:8-oxo-dGTP pyrophosphatase MutT (NUDIX family)
VTAPAGPDDAGRVDRLVRQLEAHTPRDAREEHSLRRALAMIAWLPRPFDEDADPCHVTASAIVHDGRGRVVLHRHKRLGIWLQPGGHVDPGETCEQAALREVEEETGLGGVLDERVSPLHVDVHDGPRGHLHLDVRWLVRVPRHAVPAPPPGESQAVRLLPRAEAIALTDTAAASAIRAAAAVDR